MISCRDGRMMSFAVSTVRLSFFFVNLCENLEEQPNEKAMIRNSRDGSGIILFKRLHGYGIIVEERHH